MMQDSIRLTHKKIVSRRAVGSTAQTLEADGLDSDFGSVTYRPRGLC